MNHLPIIFMFSGQGSQYYHMGEDLFHRNPTFKYFFEIADKASNLSIAKRVFDEQYKKNEPFTDLLISHPAIFITEYALAQTLLENNIYPNAVLGASLGEITAAVIAGILSFDDALECVIQQANLIVKLCQEGSMLAVIHDPNLFEKEAFLHDHSQLSGINFPTHFIISGAKEEIAKIEHQLRQNKIESQQLPVLYAFHSTFMEPVRIPFLKFVKSLTFKECQLPFISCIQSEHYDGLHFWEAGVKPIFFQKTIQELELKQFAFYIDVGPSGTLATFVKYNLKQSSQSRYFPILTPFGNSEKLLSDLIFQVR